VSATPSSQGERSTTGRGHDEPEELRGYTAITAVGNLDRLHGLSAHAQKGA